MEKFLRSRSALGHPGTEMIGEGPVASKRISLRRALIGNTHREILSSIPERAEQEASVGAEGIPVHRKNERQLILGQVRNTRLHLPCDVAGRSPQNPSFNLKFRNKSQLCVEGLSLRSGIEL